VSGAPPKLSPELADVWREFAAAALAGATSVTFTARVDRPDGQKFGEVNDEAEAKARARFVGLQADALLLEWFARFPGEAPR